MIKLLKATLAAAFLLGSAASHADTFQGSVWYLSYSGTALPDLDPLHETYRVTLGVDLAGYNGGGTFLDQVALKVSDNIYSASIYDAPGGSSDWTLIAGGLNAGGCAGSGGGFECADSNFVLNGGRGVAVTNPKVGADYSWVFDVTVNNGALLKNVAASSIKARFVNNSDAKAGDLVSENITLTTDPNFVSSIPEPGSYAFVLSGLGLLGVIALRRRPRL